MWKFVKSIVLLFYITASTFADKKLPDSFMLGAGSASYQIEGGWNEDGRGLGMWDVYLHKNDWPNGDVAADSYHKWAEDVENVKKLGLNYYRFSISWSRILPDGTLNHINQAGVDYYLNIVKALKAAGVEPIITLYHWDLPQHINLNGGFLNTQFVDYFEAYARLCFELYGSYVKYWLTLNEPFEICRDGVGGEFLAPALNLTGDGLYQCSYVLLKAHARAYHAYDTDFRSKYNGKVGIVINSEWREAASNSTLDLETQERALQFSMGWFANPIFNGNWPQVMIDRIANRSKLEGLPKSRLPEFTQEEINYINGTHDFFAFNTYGTQIVSYQDDAPIGSPNYLFDRSVNTSEILYDPQGIRKLINFINDRYRPQAIINTENGKSEDKIEDLEKIEFHRKHISNVVDAIVIDNINVIGYTVWSLIDDFEWRGYSLKYGLIRIDFDSPNRTRTWKQSARWYQNVATTRILDD